MRRTDLLLLLQLTLAAHSTDSGRPEPQQQPVKYERGDCLYETVVCLMDDSCGPLLRLVHAYCYETADYLQDRPDGSQLACDSSCAAVLSVFFNTRAGARLMGCNHTGHQFWADLVLNRQAACAPLLARTDRLLVLAAAGIARTECWLAGLLCASDFACRSTLLSVLALPCYDGPCSPQCSARMTSFGIMFSDIFHTFHSCLCVTELAAACPQPAASGYLSNRSAALDSVAFAAPLDALIDQLGRGAIREQMRDSVWLLKVFEHGFYCGSIKAILSEPNCVPPAQRQPTVSETLCNLEAVYQWPPSTAAPFTTDTSAISSTASSEPTPAAATSSSSQQLLQPRWRQPTAQPEAADATAAVIGAQRLEFIATASLLLLLACSALAPLIVTRLTL